MLMLPCHKPVGHLGGSEDNGKEEEIRDKGGRRKKRRGDKKRKGEGKGGNRRILFLRFIMNYYLNILSGARTG